MSLSQRNGVIRLEQVRQRKGTVSVALLTLVPVSWRMSHGRGQGRRMSRETVATDDGSVTAPVIPRRIGGEQSAQRPLAARLLEMDGSQRKDGPRHRYLSKRLQ